MLGTGAPKDNANPTIHAVEEDRGERNCPLGWSQLEGLHVIPPTIAFADDDKSLKAEAHAFFGPTPADRAVQHAIMESWEATRGDSTKILRHAGVGIPKYSDLDKSSSVAKTFLQEPPTFIPACTQQEQQQLRNHNLQSISGKRDPITPAEIFSIIRSIQDPEHSGVTLEQLRVVSPEQIEVNDIDDRDRATNDIYPSNESGISPPDFPSVTVRFTPTIPHCSMATLIGLSIRVKLMRSLPRKFKLRVYIEPGTHNSEQDVNKQLADKERVAAALENQHLLGIVNKCIREGMLLQ